MMDCQAIRRNGRPRSCTVSEGMDWKRILSTTVWASEKAFDHVRRRIDQILRPGRPARIEPYRTYGTAARVRVRGRVLHGRPPAPATPDDPWWVNLTNAYRRMASAFAAGARVRISFAGAVQEMIADDEGFFTADLEPTVPPDPSRLWHPARVDLLSPVGTGGRCLVAIPTHARFGIISDLDDTVIHTGATSLLHMTREALFGNVHTRLPFPGVGTFYRALHTAGGSAFNPVFYVSSSPWNLYDLLDEFLYLHGIPAGPMELRDWGMSRDELLPAGHSRHKRLAIDRILRAYPGLDFLLVGDSGQEDPEIYRRVVDDHPGRVLAIYIRSVVPDPRRIETVNALAEELAETGNSELVLVHDTLDAARHAARRGWIHPAAVEAVARTQRTEA